MQKSWFEDGFNTNKHVRGQLITTNPIAKNHKLQQATKNGDKKTTQKTRNGGDRYLKKEG
jgi:hypothetical protein